MSSHIQQVRRSADPPLAASVEADARPPGLVWAFRFKPDGTPQPMADAALPSEPGNWCWIHVNLADARAPQWLASAGLPPRARDLLLSKDSFQQMHGGEDCIYGVIADLKRDIADITDDTGFLRFVITEKLLITGRHQALCGVDATRRELERGQRIDSAIALFEAIIGEIANATERVIDGIAGELDRLEEKVLSDDTVDVRQGLGQIRRSCVRLHRHLSGLRIVLHRFERDDTAGLKPVLQLRADKLAQRLNGLDHSVVEMRERSRLLQEELHLQIEEQTSNSLRVLSVLTALLLPPTLVTGLFGMNIKGLPFTDIDGGFLWAVLMILLSSAAAFVVMKRIGLIR